MEIDKITIAMVIVFVAVLLFFMITLSGDSNTAGQAVSQAGQFVGGGCGR